MSKRRKPKRKPSGPPAANKRIWIVIALTVVLGIGAALVGLLWDRDGWVSMDGVVQIDEKTLFVYGNSGSDVDVRRWFSLGELGSDGVIRNRIFDEGAITVVGVTNEVVWLDHFDRKVHARHLPGLELIPGIGEAVANHPVLSNRYQVIGITPQGAVLTGPDSKRYLVKLDATIERAPDDLEYAMRGASLRTFETPPTHDLTMKRALEIAKANDELTQPVPISAGVAGVPLVLDDPPSFLVRTFDFYKGGQTHTLHRVTLDGKVLWSVTVETLLDAVETDGQSILIVWTGLLDGQLHALVELSEFFSGESSSDDYSTHAQTLVKIDPATGKVTAATPVTAAEED